MCTDVALSLATQDAYRLPLRTSYNERTYWYCLYGPGCPRHYDLCLEQLLFAVLALFA